MGHDKKTLLSVHIEICLVQHALINRQNNITITNAGVIYIYIYIYILYCRKYNRWQWVVDIILQETYQGAMSIGRYIAGSGAVRQAAAECGAVWVSGFRRHVWSPACRAASGDEEELKRHTDDMLESDHLINLNPTQSSASQSDLGSPQQTFTLTFTGTFLKSVV